MSRATVIVALVIAVLLGGATILLTSPSTPAAAPAAAPTLDFSPAAVTELRIQREGGPEVRVVRAADPGEWTLVGGTDGAGWPVMSTPVRAGLRLLSTLELESSGDGAPSLGEGTASITILLDDGARRTVRFGTRQLGGRVPAEISAPTGTASGWAPADLAAAFVTSGPQHWRDPAALPLAGPETSRIRLVSGDRSIALARVQGRWSLREPLAAPADPEAVGKLVAALAAARITDFLDDPAAARAAVGLDQPTASALLEADRRTIDGERVASRTVRQELHIGAPADLAGKTLFARVARASEGAGSDETLSRPVIVETGALASLSTDPTTYIARTALQMPAGDVAEVHVTLLPDAAPKVFRRDLDRWTVLDQQAGASPITAEQAAGLDRFLALLTDSKATGVRLTAPEDAEPVASAELRDLAGNPIATLRIGARPTTDSAAVTVDDGAVWRTYPADASEPTLRWLADLAR